MKGFKSAIKWIAAIVVICVVVVFLASINGLSVNRTAITVNGSVITEKEYRYYVESAKMQVFNAQGIMDEESAKEFLKTGMVEGKSALDYIKDEALEQAIRNEIAVVKAKEAGLELTEEEISSARSTEGMEETIKMYGVNKDTYADIMEKMQLTYKYYTHLLTTNEEIFETTDEEVSEKINEAYSLVQHVLIANKPEGAEEVDEAYAKEAKKEAEAVLAKAVAGENFAELIAEYNEDPGMESNPRGYLITSQGYTFDGQSQMIPEFTNGAFAVAPDEVNPELIESSFGWHIIKRNRITEVNENYMTIVQNVKNGLSYDKYSEYVDSFNDSVEIVKNENIIKGMKVKY